jgi:hypothetical protein
MADHFTLDQRRFTGLYASAASPSALPDGGAIEMCNLKIGQDGALELREGYSPLFESDVPIRGIWAGKFGTDWHYLAVAGDTLYRSGAGFGSMQALEGTVPGDEKVHFVAFYDGIYLLTGEGIRCFDGTALREIVPYVPTVTVATTPAGAGVRFEEPNLLTLFCKQSFSSDGTSTSYFLFTRSVSDVTEVSVDGKVLEKDTYYWDEAYCKLVFLKAPAKGVDNVLVTFELLGESAADRIYRCRFGVGFGGANDTRVFLYGNRDTPAMRYHSGVVDGKPSFAYFPELAYTLVGSGSPITSILRQYDRQLIFTEQSAYYSYLEYTTGESGNLVASFPVLPLSGDRGCAPEGEALLVENDPVTLMDSGLFRWVGTNIRDERNAKNISASIALALQKERAEDAVLFYRKAKSELYLCFGGRVYVYNVEQKCFCCYLLPEIKGMTERENEFYFYTEQGIYRMCGSSDAGSPIPFVWESGVWMQTDVGVEKNLYALALSGETEESVRLQVQVKSEQEHVSYEKKIFLPSGKEYADLRLRLPLRRVKRFRIRLESETAEPFRLSGIKVKGKLLRK